MRVYTAVLLGVLASGCTSTTAQPTEQRTYVAMGDSAAAAPLVPDPAEPAGCLKSTNNYPSVVARRIAPTNFVDVTCTGATTDDITRRAQPTRSGPVPPQIDAVNTDTDLVTITIGGNDVGLSAAAMRCRITSLADTPCAEKFVDADGDRMSRAIDDQVPTWASMIDAVRAKAPDARIILVGYGIYIRPGGCFPDQQAHPRDADYFQAKVDELNDRQRQLAAEKGVEYFDIRPLSHAHDMCAAPADRYFEGFEPVQPALPLHPNAFGAAAVGNALADHIG